MRIVYNDPIAELKILVAKAAQYSNVSHIALTSGEMRTCLEHKNAAEVFPNFIENRKAELLVVRNELHSLRVKVHDDSMPIEEKQPHFERMDDLQAEEDRINRHIPKMIREGNVVFKVSMK